jgi:hypothetical protein
LTGGKSPRFIEVNLLMIADEEEEKGIETNGFHEKVINEIE